MVSVWVGFRFFFFLSLSLSLSLLFFITTFRSITYICSTTILRLLFFLSSSIEPRQAGKTRSGRVVATCSKDLVSHGTQSFSIGPPLFLSLSLLPTTSAQHNGHSDPNSIHRRPPLVASTRVSSHHETDGNSLRWTLLRWICWSLCFSESLLLPSLRIL